VGKAASEIMERAIAYTFDDSKFDRVMRLVRDDYLLAGRGNAWPRYEPDFDDLTDDEGNLLSDDGEKIADDDKETKPGQELADERVKHDFVGWRDFGHNIARNWQEVRQVWRIVYMSRREGVKRFKDVFKDVPLDWKSGDLTDEKSSETSAKSQARVYEIWDKSRGKVVFVAKAAKRVLEEIDPPIKYGDFFPCPEPVYGTTHAESMIPVPDYVFYQDQVEEIDDLTARIGALTDSLKLAGLYQSTSTEASDAIVQLAKPGVENVLIPVPNWAQFKEGGGTKGMIEWWPVEKVVEVLQECFAARKQIIEDVYQITGLSDIMRGQGDPDETAAAQHIKSQWGSLRVRDRQHEMARFARDMARKTAEIIAQQFSPETLMRMTNIKLPTQAEVEQQQLMAQIEAQRQAQMQQMQQMQQQAPPMGNNGGPPMQGAM